MLRSFLKWNEILKRLNDCKLIIKAEVPQLAYQSHACLLAPAILIDLFLLSFFLIKVLKLSVRLEGAANNCSKLSYRVLNRRDQINDLIEINDLIVIMSKKENGNVAVK